MKVVAFSIFRLQKMEFPIKKWFFKCLKTFAAIRIFFSPIFWLAKRINNTKCFCNFRTALFFKKRLPNDSSNLG
jgi:hypothetical protein